ncbi:glycosyltransferase [Salinarimonas ramus]|uniref:Cellulose synthase (UDP-forming) n=1 Tax=Salinarimonas ramus TaxID=690164 RepID=A0A917V7Y9_9HYPH|nr:cellulose synthase catalytic subunit [Salinarimonas ramus]GGK48780.1 hypothetical protein GCM10011322_39780 [Salinarimonas ramus]
MIALPGLLSALAGTALVLAVQLLLLPVLDARRTLWRVLLLGAAVILAWRYMAWRFTDTLAPLGFTVDAFASWSFAILEAGTVVSSTIAFAILTRVRDRSREADANLAWWGAAAPPPRVDVYIATYNEEESVLERTLVGAKLIRHPATRVFVLDDGRRDWLADLCARHGVGYLRRPDNAHAKAGNLNHALSERLAASDAPDFVAILDADFVPHPHFVGRALALFHDPAVGLVQTPQHFFNPDPVQHNLGISTAYPDEQRHFFDNVEPARDAWGIAVCCGTSSMVRVSALEAIGGFPTQSVTEDFLLSLKLAENGLSTVYLNEPLTEGLAPEGLKEYIVQRGRWCLGMMEIVRKVYNPLARNGLPLRHRLSIVDSLLYWTTTFPFRMAGLVFPLLYWWLGVTVVDATVHDVLVYYLPYYLLTIAVLNWISRGLFIPVVNDVAQLLAAWPIMRATASGLLTKGPHRFSVTAKGGDRTRTVVQWPMMRPFLVLFALTVGGLVATLNSDFLFNNAAAAGDGMVVVLFWTIYNLFVLLVAIAACIERPREDRPMRQEARAVTIAGLSGAQPGWLVDLGVAGAQVSGPSGFAAGEPARLDLPTIGSVEAVVDAPTGDGVRLRLEPTPSQREAIIALLHTADAAPGTGRGDLVQMARELARALSS